jgi:hypothetical protein
LILCHARTAPIVDAEVSAHNALAGHKARSKHRYAVALGIVSIAIDDRVLNVAVVDVERATVYSGTVRQISLAAVNRAVVAHPGPYGIGRANRLRFLHSCIPRNARIDYALAHAKQDNAIPLHIMDRRIANDDVGAPIALGGIAQVAAADENTDPLIGVPSVDAVHQHVVEVLIHIAGRDRDEATLLMLDLAGEDIMNCEVGKMNVVENAFVAADEDAIRIRAGEIERIDVPILWPVS